MFDRYHDMCYAYNNFKKRFVNSNLVQKVKSRI